MCLNVQNAWKIPRKWFISVGICPSAKNAMKKIKKETEVNLYAQRVKKALNIL